MLRRSALVWHSVELSDMERDYLQTCPISSLKLQLIKCFKKQAPVALQALATSRFTLADIRAGKSLRGFAQEMIRNARAAEMTSAYNQLLSVWNGLDVPLQMLIPLPDADMTLLQFFTEVDKKEPIFYNMAHRGQRDRELRQDTRRPNRPLDKRGISPRPPPAN